MPGMPSPHELFRDLDGKLLIRIRRERSDNRRSLQQNPRLGFREIYIMDTGDSRQTVSGSRMNNSAPYNL